MSDDRRRRVALTVLLCLAAFAGVLAQQQPSPHVLLGEWKVVSGSFAGQPLPPAQLPPMTLKFEKNGHWSDSEGGEAAWSTDDAKTPKTLDLDHTSGRDRGKKQPCVYEVAGDKLTIAFGLPGGKESDRPTSLSTAAINSNTVVFTFERIKK